jgi:hypothetical protein
MGAQQYQYRELRKKLQVWGVASKGTKDSKDSCRKKKKHRTLKNKAVTTQGPATSLQTDRNISSYGHKPG